MEKSTEKVESSLMSAKPSGIYLGAVSRILSQFQKGTLAFVYPDGQVETYGCNTEVVAHMRVKNWNFFWKCFYYGDIGLGESYVDGDWESTDLYQLMRYFLVNITHIEGASGGKKHSFQFNLLRFFNVFQNMMRKSSRRRAQKNIHQHYDLSNAFFKLMLDETMTYSSGIFKTEEDTLYTAQINKYSHLAQKLQLNAKDTVLEIGSGWGSNAIFMAQTYGCKVDSITISKQQYAYAKKKVEDAGLAHLVNIIYQDFRDVKKRYDKIVSVEMLEAVGESFLDTYFKKIEDVLNPDGLVAIQVITSPDSRYNDFKKGVDWIQKHIFPGSLLPSIARIHQATAKFTKLHLFDFNDIGLDYARTLNVWRKNFFENIKKVKLLGFDDTFIRKWEYYLVYCEAAFAMRNISDVQLFFSRPNNRRLM